MPDDLHAKTFVPHAGTTFTVRLADAEVPLVLADVHEEPEQPHAPRPDPFSLTFTGSPETFVQQGVYALTHPVLGELDVFLVPRQPHADGLARYEAVFN